MRSGVGAYSYDFCEGVTCNIHMILVKGSYAIKYTSQQKITRSWSLEKMQKIQLSSIAQFCLTLCNSMYCSMPGLPVHHQLLDFTHSCPLSQWCHPTVSSSAVPFFSHLQTFCHSVMSNPLRPHELQHARIPCASLPLGVCSLSPLNQLSPPTHVYLSR